MLALDASGGGSIPPIQTMNKLKSHGKNILEDETLGFLILKGQNCTGWYNPETQKAKLKGPGYGINGNFETLDLAYRWLKRQWLNYSMYDALAKDECEEYHEEVMNFLDLEPEILV